VLQEVLAHKQGIDNPSMQRLKTVTTGLTATRANHRLFNDYIQNPPRKAQDYEERMWEDVEFLVSQFNEHIGRTWRDLRQPQTFNRFSVRGVRREKAVPATMEDVHEKLPAWLQHLKSSNIIFEEPEIEHIVLDDDTVVDLLEDWEPPAPAEAEDAQDKKPSTSASKWSKVHPTTSKETDDEQLKQAEELMGRGAAHSARQALLWEKRVAAEAVQAQEAEKEAEIAAQRAVAASEKVYEVEYIVRKRVVDDEVQYRVHWLGYESNKRTWEKADDLQNARAKIAKYEARIKTKK
jgi:hypothetical protein